MDGMRNVSAKNGEDGRPFNVHYPYITVHLTQTIVRNVALPEKYRDKFLKTIFTTTSNQNVLGIALELCPAAVTISRLSRSRGFSEKPWQTASPSTSNMPSSKSRVCNVEMAFLLAKINPSSDTRSCTQCTRQVPKTQRYLTCENCREKQQRKKARRKERQLAGEAGVISTAKTTTIIDEYEREEAAKAPSKPSKKQREDRDKIEVEMSEDWDSAKERLKVEMAAGKGTSGKKRKGAPYGPLYVAGLAHDRAAIAECMAIVNAPHANVSSPSLSVPPRRWEIMEPLLKRQVKLFRFSCLGCSINVTLQKLSEMIPPKLSDIAGIPSSSRSKVRFFVGLRCPVA